MTFDSPNERMLSSLKRFFLLQRIDGTQFCYTIWFITLVVYGFNILVQGYRVAGALSFDHDFLFTVLVWGQAWLAPLVVWLLWLFIIRVVLEVCLRLLEWHDRQGTV